MLNSFWEELALVQAEAPGLVTGRGLCFFLAALLHSLLQAHFRLLGLQGTMVVDPCWSRRRLFAVLEAAITRQSLSPARDQCSA